MTRFVAVGLVVLASLAGAGVARAQTSMPLPNGAALEFKRFLVEKGGMLVDPENGDEVRRFLNAAHCTCNEVDLSTATFGYEITLSANTGLARPVDIYVGTNCGDPQQINNSCLKVGSITSIDAIRLGETKVRVPLYQAVNVKDMGMCRAETSTVTVWLMVDIDGNSTYEHWTEKAVPAPFSDMTIKGVDVKPPVVPNLRASGSEETIDISWTAPADSTDLFYFQALCATVDDAPVDGVTMPEQKYQRVNDVCSAPETISLAGVDPMLAGEVAVDVVPPPFETLEPAFLCGQAGMGETSLQIGGLKNGTRYKIAFIAVDNYGNFAGSYFTSTITPRPVTDFWEDLNDRNSAVDGGCLLSTTYGDGNPLTRTLREFRDGTLARSALGRWLTDAYYATLGRLAVESLPARIAAGIALAPLVALALLWHLLGLPALLVLLALPWLWRSRAVLPRGRRRLAMAGAVALLLAPGLAAADDLTPYWEDPAQEDSSLDAPGDVKWIAGLRLGPYIPDIDLQFHQNASTKMGPYEAMFGDYWLDDTDGDGRGETKHEQRVWQIMPMLDVDRVVWRGFGQLAVGGSIGYMQKSAYSYQNGTSEDHEDRARSTSSKNTFRLLPLAATVTYRLTYADDRWGIPVIPYVRGGLSYYMWWMRGPNGTSKVCEEEGGTMCTEDKAYGGTPGVQVSGGLAVRAERIDRDAARSMRNSGIQHAGFYAEVFWGRVDGFGSETKLWVGDTTWFAGANFEF